jgi:hypothetical protein
MISSTFFTPEGQRRLQVLQVVQAHNSALFEIEEKLSIRWVSLTSLLILSGERYLTGQPPVQVPHWIQMLS